MNTYFAVGNNIGKRVEGDASVAYYLLTPQGTWTLNDYTLRKLLSGDTETLDEITEAQAKERFAQRFPNQEFPQ